MNIDLSTDAPPSPQRTLQLAETFAELVRVMNHATMHHEALRYPSEADRFLRDLARGIAGLPQLLDQAGRWLAAEYEAGRIGVPSGTYAGDPRLAVATARLRLDTARATAAALGQDLERAAEITSDLAGAEDGTGD